MAEEKEENKEDNLILDASKIIEGIVGGKALDEHSLVYDSAAETLEPVYFWLLDYMNGIYRGDVTKLIDNFASSPGSGHFSEMGGKATRMQEEGMKMMQTIGILVKSLVNIIYDLREFEQRFKQYDTSKSSDKNAKEAGILSLKQIWMDNVDIKRGRGSINMLAQDLNFVTIRDAFMVLNSLEDIKKTDLVNDRVKRILEPRIAEFLQWKDLSEKELRKRYDIERSWLKSQVNSLKLYARWAKPYFKYAEQLRVRNPNNPAIVTAFNTVLLQITLLAKKPLNIKEAAITDKTLPQTFANKKLKREYYSCVLVNFTFRGIPQRVGGQQSHYAFGGRVDVSFKGYVMNGDEIKMLNQKMDEDDINTALTYVEGTVGEPLKALEEDLEYFLKDDKEREKDEKAKAKDEDSNPFTALFSFFKKNDNKKKKEKKKDEKITKIRKDDFVEKSVRELLKNQAKEDCFTVFETYKKAHGMPSFP